MASIQIGAAASDQERFAAQEIQTFVRNFTQAELPIVTNREPTSTQTVIILGTLASNPTIEALSIEIDADLGKEGYGIKTVETNGEIVVVIGANTERGVIHGAYAFVEACITALTGLSPVHPDFLVIPSRNLNLPYLDEKSRPFYPVRAVLETDDPVLLSRNRINMSGGEGVWTGTGIDDGLGTAFKYVAADEFEVWQDEPRAQRQDRIHALRERFDALHRRGIDSYLFMYVTGEATEALIRERPHLFGPTVAYGTSRNGESYLPFCWSRPEIHDLVRKLVKEIVFTYPTLSGFHLRSWGNETRACKCPECGDRSESGQHLLWQIYFSLIDAAREVRPDFKFYISGYDSSWLRDPERDYIRQLPAGTIFSQKWGIDGEPVPHAEVPTSQLDVYGELGHHFIVLSHDVEEVMPLWMLEGDLFVEGVRQLANNPEAIGLGGFTIQGAHQGFGRLDRILSAKLNWDVDLDYVSLLENDLTTRVGSDAARLVLKALRINSWTLSSYFGDYAGSRSVTGKYGDGSRGYATRFWDLIGKGAVEDILSIPNLAAARYAAGRHVKLLDQQRSAVDELGKAWKIAIPASQMESDNLSDTTHIMQLWLLFFKSRTHLIEAVTIGYEGGTENQIRTKLDNGIEFSRSMLHAVQSIEAFVPVFGYSHTTLEAIVIERIEDEIAWLSNLDASVLIRPEDTESDLKILPIEIRSFYSHPNPSRDHATLTYELSRDADEVSISVYTSSGRRIRRLENVPAKKGYNEVMWDARDEEGEPLANGTYISKIHAISNGDEAQTVGRIAILK
ncbi:MAG: alpha-glucuronidase family glycosyl hydrolase [Candidatus Poribacteria bacterium]|nr:alpha-glucuronidase family glycosyl hydrolase [Candidatus Poribacteria bacterium]MDE0506935.1 alpha-glucuronidase family glycosyl hydrolase [Candidatus Poribacteria bacterium]